MMKRRKNRKIINNKNRKNKGGKYIVVTLLTLLALTVAVGTFAWVWGIRQDRKDRETVDLLETEQESSTEMEEITETASAEEPSKEEADYPEPTYPFRVEELVVEVPGLSGTYTVAWVSDLHMVTDHEISDDILDEDMEAVRVRYDFFQTADGVHGEDLLPQVIDFLNYGDFDGIIFGS